MRLLGIELHMSQPPQRRACVYNIRYIHLVTTSSFLDFILYNDVTSKRVVLFFIFSFRWFLFETFPRPLHIKQKLPIIKHNKLMSRLHIQELSGYAGYRHRTKISCNKSIYFPLNSFCSTANAKMSIRLCN